jgi:hypothetical protein
MNPIRFLFWGLLFVHIALVPIVVHIWRMTNHL